VIELTVTQLKAAAQRIATVAKAASDELNTADGKLGDGDLGITVTDGWREATIDMGNAPDDIGLALLACSKAFQRVSPSSFGTLTATALMAAAKQTKGRAGIPWSEISSLVASARDAMMARGKGALGDKSVLDALDAVATATAGLDEPGSILAAADRATDDALRAFRDRPAKLGRARMFGEKSIGLDDPGMLAFRRMLDGLVKP
jgi:dihydroxyacetone kinase-like protein